MTDQYKTNEPHTNYNSKTTRTIAKIVGGVALLGLAAFGVDAYRQSSMHPGSVNRDNFEVIADSANVGEITYMNTIDTACDCEYQNNVRIQASKGSEIGDITVKINQK